LNHENYFSQIHELGIGIFSYSAFQYTMFMCVVNRNFEYI